MNRTVVVISDDVLKSQASIPCNFELKTTNETISIPKPLRSLTIEAVLDYCRVVYDILPEEAAVSVVCGDVNPQILNDWSIEQQSFLYLSNQFGQLKSMNMFETTRDEVKSKSVEQLYETILNHILESKKVDTTECKLRFIYFVNASAENIEQFEKDVLSNMFQEFSKKLKQYHSYVKKKIFFQFDIVTTITDASQDFKKAFFGDKGFTSKTFRDMKDPQLSIEMNTWFVSIDSLWELMLHIANTQHSLITITVKGIPMRETSSKTNTQYDVELACKAFAIDISQDVFNLSSNVNLNWVRADPKASVENLHLTKSVHRITPKFPYTQPAICLMKHLAAGKPVTLCMESSYNKKHQHTTTHMILQHGTDFYLHVLSLCKSFDPWLTIPRNHTPKVKYRSKEFMEIISQHILYGPQTDDGDEVMFDEVKEGKGKTSNMVHHSHRYKVPTSVERKTRLFPLCQDEKSVLFNTGVYPTLRKLIQPLIDIVIKDKLTENDRKKAKKILTKLYQCAQKNDTKLLPELAQKHTERWETYRKVWGELRIFIITLAHNSILSIMDKQWPQFFFDNTTSDKPQVETRRNKRLVDVQRDRHGNVIFPIPLGALTIHSLGKVVYDRPAYHTDKYIWPVGFKSTRYYTSMVNIDRRCLYTCEIRDGGNAPQFVLTCEDCKDKPIIQSSATAAWTVVVKCVNDLKSEETGKRVFTNVSGPEYYGLAHPTVMKLISELPNAEKCFRPNCVHQPARKPDDKLEERSESEESAEETEEKPDETKSLDPKELRDQQIQKKKEQSKHKIHKLHWEPRNSFLDYVSKKYSTSTVAVEFDGRSAGEQGLYSHLQQSEQSDTQPHGTKRKSEGPPSIEDEGPAKKRKQNIPGLGLG